MTSGCRTRILELEKSTAKGWTGWTTSSRSSWKCCLYAYAPQWNWTATRNWWVAPIYLFYNSLDWPPRRRRRRHVQSSELWTELLFREYARSSLILRSWRVITSHRQVPHHLVVYYGDYGAMLNVRYMMSRVGNCERFKSICQYLWKECKLLGKKYRISLEAGRPPPINRWYDVTNETIYKYKNSTGPLTLCKLLDKNLN